MRASPSAHRLWEPQSGASFIEFTLGLVVILLLLAGAVDVGGMLAATNSAQEAVSQACRVAANLEDLNQRGTPDPRVVRALNYRLDTWGFLSSPNITVIGPTTPTNPQVGACGQTVTVRLAATYRPRLLRMFGFVDIPLTKQASMRYSRQPLCNQPAP